MDIFEALRISHETQRALAQQLLQTSGESAERQRIFTALKQELAAHATAEERCFYMPLMAHDAGVDISRHGIAEHHEMDEMVEALEQTSMRSPGWLAAAHALSDKIHHHLREEEHGYFQLAGRLMTQAQKTALAREYEAEFTSQRVKP